jgi:hypothetical protein
VAYLLLQQGASASTLSTTGWPPSQAVQQGLVNQFSAMASATLGRPLTPQEATNIGNGVAQAPQEYVATLAGAAPTVAGYQTWALTQLYGALMATSQFAATTSSMVTG